MPVVGAVLCGGASRRMGRDKALVEVDGVALARRAADALRAGGCSRVVAVGGDAVALAALGLEPVPDRWPGEGPLGGVGTALAAVSEGTVLVIAPCDWVTPGAVAGVLVADLVAAAVAVSLSASPSSSSSVPSAAAVVAHPVVAGRAQWLPSAWVVGPSVAEGVAALVAGGARRLDAVASVVAGRPVAVAPSAVADADTPGDLP